MGSGRGGVGGTSRWVMWMKWLLAVVLACTGRLVMPASPPQQKPGYFPWVFSPGFCWGGDAGITNLPVQANTTANNHFIHITHLLVPPIPPPPTTY